jgi:hypothetical protein
MKLTEILFYIALIYVNLSVGAIVTILSDYRILFVLGLPMTAFTLIAIIAYDIKRS